MSDYYLVSQSYQEIPSNSADVGVWKFSPVPLSYLGQFAIPGVWVVVGVPICQLSQSPTAQLAHIT